MRKRLNTPYHYYANKIIIWQIFFIKNYIFLQKIKIINFGSVLLSKYQLNRAVNGIANFTAARF